MGYQVDNAIIMAAGLSSRFAPLSYEKPKALIKIKGEILLERQIRQLLDSGIPEIVLITGYKKEQFYYLKEKYGVLIIENKEYAIRNNNSSIWAAKNYLKNSYICSADNYFTINPFEKEVDTSYYAALFSPGNTDEWCLETDSDDWITGIKIGGCRQWYMMGHAFWSSNFSHKFIRILEDIYYLDETKPKLWETIYQEHLPQLQMKIRRYNSNEIYEFDSLDELRLFDKKYLNHSGSTTMQKISRLLNCSESEMTAMRPLISADKEVTGVAFKYKENTYYYNYETGEIQNEKN